jgi:hypothetical protein
MKRQTKTMWMLGAMAVALGACQAPTSAPAAAPVAPEPEPLELVTYDAPEGVAERIEPILTRVLAEVGNAELLPGGKVLVAAPASLQAGVAKLFEDTAGLTAKPRAYVTLEYWVVVGQEAAPVSMTGEVATQDPRLDALAGVLDPITKTQGHGHYRLLDRVTLSSLEGERARSQGIVLQETSQIVTVQGGKVQAQVELELDERAGYDHKIDTVLLIESGQTVVLGSAGYREPGREDLEPTGGSTSALYYIVRATTDR